MTCYRCKGTIEQKLRTHAATLEQCVIIVKNVPALVCTQCGEVYFNSEVAQKLENILDGQENIIKEVAIVDYSNNVA
jgi:YgiT-type zinc finger domain-containing protein